MVAGTADTNKGTNIKNQKSITSNHAYSLLNAVTVTVKGKQERLLQIRDPIG